MSTIERGRTLGEQVYRVIRERIILGEFTPGQVLVESELAEELEVSRTPVSNAFTMLKERGLLEGRSGRPTVPRLSLKDVTDLYGCRLALDGLATRLACEAITDDDLVRLEEDLKLWEEPASEDDRKALWVADLGFHETIYAVSGNSHLMRFAQIATELVIVYRHRTVRRPDATEHGGGGSRTQDDIRAEHRTILDALRSRDPDRAERAARDHIESIIRHLHESEVTDSDPT